MVSMLFLSVVDHGFEHQLGQTKAYKIGICCFSIKQTALRSKNKDIWLISVVNQGIYNMNYIANDKSNQRL
jgi:hypothetical protein